MCLIILYNYFNIKILNKYKDRMFEKDDEYHEGGNDVTPSADYETDDNF